MIVGEWSSKRASTKCQPVPTPARCLLTAYSPPCYLLQPSTNRLMGQPPGIVTNHSELSIRSSKALVTSPNMKLTVTQFNQGWWVSIFLLLHRHMSWEAAKEGQGSLGCVHMWFESCQEEEGWDSTPQRILRWADPGRRSRDGGQIRWMRWKRPRFYIWTHFVRRFCCSSCRLLLPTSAQVWTHSHFTVNGRLNGSLTDQVTVCALGEYLEKLLSLTRKPQ